LFITNFWNAPHEIKCVITIYFFHWF
jgi:hypothetical protein